MKAAPWADFMALKRLQHEAHAAQLLSQPHK
jgi:hypothetical protein